MTRTPPDLPERMTWDELADLPDEIAREIELWEGRPVWVRTAPPPHQAATNVLWSALRSCRPQSTTGDVTEQCFRVYTETNVFFDPNKSDYNTPHFLVARCRPVEADWLQAEDVLLVGEVLSASNSEVDIETKKARYAKAGIPWYWEVSLSHRLTGFRSIRIYGRVQTTDNLPGGVHPLRTANYVLAGEWSPNDGAGLAFDHPYPVQISWAELELN